MPSPIMCHSLVRFEGGARTRLQAYAMIKRTNENNPRTGLWQIVIKETDIIRQSSRLNLFLASKTIYCETLPLYFGHNIFSFDRGDSFDKFANAIGPESRRQLAHVQCCWSGNCARAAKTLTKCVGLRDLSLHFLWFCSFSSDFSSDLNLHGRPLGMADLLRVRGLETLNLRVLGPCYKFNCPGREYMDGVRAECPSFTATKQALEVLKQPLDAKKLKRQEAQGFLVKANVTTR